MSCLLWTSTRSTGCKEEDWRDRDGGSATGKGGGSETERTKGEGKEGGREAEWTYLPAVRRRIWTRFPKH